MLQYDIRGNRHLSAGVYYVHSTNVQETGFVLGNHKRFECDSEETTFRNLTHATEINMWKRVELV
jgi:hypothetical protein